ncbi:MAG: GNAT family N-acetyltransferase [Candidatus Nanopelagicaceae bacterium]|nr:GNAT family N-acetyltransferase [Candidatus Nanopelagicaceae bacterium]
MIEIERLYAEDTTEEFLSELKELLGKTFGIGFSDDDWRHCMGGTHILIRDSGLLMAHAAVVPRLIYVGESQFRAGYVEAVATIPSRQHQGLGTMAMIETNSVIANQFEMGVLSFSSKDFYRKLGWEDWKGPSFVVKDGEWVRSESENNGIMILRTALSPTLNLGSRIACNQRPGDSW